MKRVNEDRLFYFILFLLYRDIGNLINERFTVGLVKDE